MRSLILLLMVLVAASDGVTNNDSPGNHIAIRHDVDDSRYVELGAQYPSAVRVGEQGGDGTLIAPTWVLTAAHVADGMNHLTGGSFQVFVAGQEEGIDVAQVVLHPGFAPMGPNDVALLRLDRPVTGIKPARLYRKRDEKGQQIVIVGHGDTKPGTGGEWTSDGVRRGATNIIDEVNSQYLMFDFDEPGSATELEGTAGPGDSGGPAYIDFRGISYVAGISSLGEPGEDGPGTYGSIERYVRVSGHVQWLDSVMDDPANEQFVGPGQDEPQVRQVEPGGGIVRVGPGNADQGVVKLEAIGLLIADRNGKVQMVGRIDELYPDVLLDAGIRPPAVVVKFNGEGIDSAEGLKTRFDAVDVGSNFSIEFESKGKLYLFELVR